MEKIFDIAIVGGGIVGAATAYKIQRKFPNLTLIILEKDGKKTVHKVLLRP